LSSGSRRGSIRSGSRPGNGSVWGTAAASEQRPAGIRVFRRDSREVLACLLIRSRSAFGFTDRLARGRGTDLRGPSVGLLTHRPQGTPLEHGFDVRLESSKERSSSWISFRPLRAASKSSSTRRPPRPGGADFEIGCDRIMERGSHALSKALARGESGLRGTLEPDALHFRKNRRRSEP